MTSTRNQSIELIRIAAAFGIVLFHSGASGAEFGYAGLIAFTMLATYFGGSNGKLGRRLLVPWAFWSVFYIGWRMLADGTPLVEGLGPIASLLYGTHLWFLPFICVAILASRQLKTGIRPAICGVVALAFCLAAPWWSEAVLSTQPPIAQWIHALPAALLGVAITSRAGRIIASASLLACAFWNVAGITIPYVLGGIAVLLATGLSTTRWKVEGVSSCMLGVYLVHIAALGIMNRILEPQTIATAMAAFIASVAGVWLARRHVPVTRLVLG